nr:KH domain containing protein [Hymenolepis microstoma]
MMASGCTNEFSLVIAACRCAFRTMSSYRQLTALTLVSASMFYVWYRYCRVNSESSALLSVAKKAVTRMALGSLLCCGTNPFRKRKKAKGTNTAPYVQSKVKPSKQMDQQSTGSLMEPNIKPDAVAPVQSVPPLQEETTVSSEETQCINVAETHEAVLEEEIVVAAQNLVCANAIVTPNEQVPLGTLKEFSQTVLQENSDCHGHLIGETNGSQCPLENSLSEHGNTNSTANIEVEHEPLNNFNLSSSKENVRSCNEESISAVAARQAVVNSNGSPLTYFGQGMLGIPEYQIEETEPQLHDGVLLPQVLIPPDLPIFDDPNMFRTNFVIPNTMSGIIIGKQGKNVNALKEKFYADISISPSQFDHSNIVLTVSCPTDSKEDVIKWILKRIRTKPSMTPIGNPYQLLRTTPLGELTRVFIRSSYSRKHLFVTIADECYNNFLEMEKELTADYLNAINTRLQLYDPVVVGTIAVLKTGVIYSRVFIMDIIDSNPKLAICFLLDHGTFTVAPVGDLRKIKTRYMQIPFQAVSVMWAHAQSPFVDISDENFLMRYFNNDSLYVFPVRNETCCRSDVIFFNRIEDPKQNSQYLYQDILVQAANEGYCRFAGKIINLNEQFELNGCEKAYYFCPYSSVYEGLVFYRMPNGEVVRALDVPVPRPSPEPENQQQHQQDQLVDMQRQQRQSANQRQRNDRTPNGGAVATVNGRGNNNHNFQYGGNRGQSRGKYVPNGANRPNNGNQRQ